MCNIAAEKNRKKNQYVVTISKEREVQEATLSQHFLLRISIISNFVRKVRLY
jgi:hypothetical protein